MGLSSPLRIAAALLPAVGDSLGRGSAGPASGLMVGGLYGGLVAAPPDYQQGESYRIIYVHVPSAWMSHVHLCGDGRRERRLPWCGESSSPRSIAIESAPVGASFTFLALATGALWGKPMWGTYWVWGRAAHLRARPPLFLYFGVIGLHAAIEDRRTAGRAAGLFAIVGVVNIPIIHYSVEWWHTLHQGPDGDQALGAVDSRLDAGAVAAHGRIVQTLLRHRAAAGARVPQVLERERNAGWGAGTPSRGRSPTDHARFRRRLLPTWAAMPSTSGGRTPSCSWCS